MAIAMNFVAWLFVVRIGLRTGRAESVIASSVGFVAVVVYLLVDGPTHWLALIILLAAMIFGFIEWWRMGREWKRELAEAQAEWDALVDRAIAANTDIAEELRRAAAERSRLN